MTTKNFKRKLTAIFSADVAGYSRLMGEDEAATVEAITTYREIMGGLIRQHRGRVVDSPGDNLLAEFASVVDAVQCAVAVQKEFQTRNKELPENRRMRFRIGINLGDVIEEEERLYGDGVNIAARLEALADPGGICISKTAFDHIETKLPLGYEYLGDQTVKNIAKPVGAYRVLMEPRVTVIEEIKEKKGVSVWRKKTIIVGAVALLLVVICLWIWNSYFRPSSSPTEIASLEKRAYPLPDKPSIAVLPFDNMSSDPDQEYFSDGITEDLITALSKVSGLFVIARNSVFTYKGKATKVQQVGEELGVRYILEGSVRKSQNKVRITAQLVDASTGGHLWAERYDRELKDIFALQDEVTQKIVNALAVKLTKEDQKRLVHKGTDNLDAHNYFLRGLDYLYRYTKEGNTQARNMFKKSIELDPQYALAHALLGFTYMMEWNFGWSRDLKTLERSFELAQKAIALDDTGPEGHALLSQFYLWTKQHELSIAEIKKTIAMDPNNADGFAGLASVLSWAGRPEEAIELVNKAMQHNPRYPVWYLFILGHAHFLTGQYEEAIATMKRVLDRNPNFLPGYAYLLASYVELKRVEEAKAEAAKLNRLSPISFEDWRQRLPYKDEAVLERLFLDLRKAGMK
jgi:adenylate cyclase